MPYTFRFASKADAKLLTCMRLAYLHEDHPDLSAETEQQLKSRLDDYFPRAVGNDLQAVLVFDGDKVIASAYLVITEKPANLAFPTGKTGTVLNVYTNPLYRRQGIAAQMMQMLIAEGRRMDLSFIELSATAAGKPLYEHLGFSEKKSSYTAMKLQL